MLGKAMLSQTHTPENVSQLSITQPSTTPQLSIVSGTAGIGSAEAPKTFVIV